MPAPARGFTLVELLVVIVILAILGVTGSVLFINVQKGARDARRKADVESISKAFETKYSATGYVGVEDSDFSTGKIPVDPTSSKGNYFRVVANDKSGFKVCASLDDNPSNQCNSQAANCYCKVSTQSSIANTQSSNLSGDSGSILLGYGYSGSAPSCDPNGSLGSGLAGYWKFDEGSSPSSIDSSGNNSNATLVTNAGWGLGASCKFGNCLDLTVGYSTATGAQLDLGGAVTLSVWAYPRSLAYGFGLIQRRVSNPDGYPYSMLHAGSSFEYYNGTTYVSPVGTGSMNLNQWQHVVITANSDRSVVKLFRNGNKLQTGGGSGLGTTGNANKSIAFGLGNNGAPAAFNGMLDDIRIYNRELSEPEVALLYNGGNGCIP